MIKELIPAEPQECPTHIPVPFFGAIYPDAQCIEGYLWDEDSYTDEGYTSGGDIPCPFCNPVEHTEQFIKVDKVVCDECSTTLENLHWCLTSVKSIKLYGHCSNCKCNMWAKADAEES